MKGNAKELLKMRFKVTQPWKCHQIIPSKINGKNWSFGTLYFVIIIIFLNISPCKS